MADPKKQEAVQPDAIEEEDEFFGINEPDQDDPESAEDISERVKRAAGKVKQGFSTGAEGVSSVVKRALNSRDHVLMVRINDEALERITDLKDAGLFRSRSEAAAYLIAEGIATKSDLFGRIQTKIKQIQEIKDELRALAEGQEGVELDKPSDEDK
ncbi:hypothetical protein KQI63_00715 [bacterium]|nr:hypothetical protein [bacterium]